METSIIERIKQILDKENLTYGQFSERLGISVNTWKTMSRGDSGDPKSSFLKKFNEAFPYYNLYWLITGTGNMLANGPIPYLHPEDGVKAGIKEPQLPYAEFSKYLLIPLYSFDLGRNVPTDVQVAIENGSIIGFFPFTDAAEGDIALSVFGEEMKPVIPPGSYIHLRPIQRWQKNVKPGQLCFFELEDRQYLLREVQKVSKRNTFRLASYDRRFNDYELPFDMIHAVWLVKAKYEKFTF